MCRRASRWRTTLESGVNRAEVKLYGIVQGLDYFYGGLLFSSMSNINRELGYVGVTIYD